MALDPQTKEPLAVEAAARAAEELYGLRGELRELDGEWDNNFHLRADNGKEYLLKVLRAGYPVKLVDLQCKALAHLAERAPHLPLPRVQPTLLGGPIGTASPDNNGERLVWLLSFVLGKPMAKAKPHTLEFLRSVGRLLGELDAALSDFSHPAARREFQWDLAQAGWVQENLEHISDPNQRALAGKLMEPYEEEILPALRQTRRSVIHSDANDYNLLVSGSPGEALKLAGLVDFGDLLESHPVCEVAIAAAYALLGKADPLDAAAQVVAGFHSAYPLTEEELALLFPLICARLCVSVTNSARRSAQGAEDPYLTISERPAWDALEKLEALNPRFAHYVFRHACGLTPVPKEKTVTDWLEANAANCSPVLGMDLRKEPCTVFDLSVGSRFLGADPRNAETERLTKNISKRMHAEVVKVGVGRYNEPRLIYTTDSYATGGNPTDERRTIHLGVDLFVPPGSPIYAPLDGTVHLAVNNDAGKDYGPLVILYHETGSGDTFFTLYGHLSEDSLERTKPGRTVKQGEEFARIGAPPANGDWPPHLHFQLILDLLELGRDFPGVALPRQRPIWLSLSPDPNLLLGIPTERIPPLEPSREASIALRAALIGPNLSLSYDTPLKLVRGWMQYLYDDTAQAYLDAFNNVPHVGHSHPRVVKAIQEQAALLNTNTRYLHDNLTRYAERLCAKLPEALSVCYFVNSASEANELALRLARAHTNREDVLVLEGAYHGHTTTLVDVSPYKFSGPGGSGPKPWVHVAPLPDDYRGTYKRNDPEAGKKYAEEAATVIDRLQKDGRKPAAFLCESLPSVGGQIVFPPGYLKKVYGHVREAGGVCIADEVQVGLGRLGKHFWGFEQQGVVPDIVVLGKPIGNGHPLGAVITTREIAHSFDNGMEFFSTFGGNPVSCAAGLAVLDVLEQEGLPENAGRVGEVLLTGLRVLQEKHSLIGDVRGMGLFIGVELVRDRGTLEPAAKEAAYVVNRLRERGILIGVNGPLENVLKIRPPLCFTKEDARFLLQILEEIMEEDPAQVRDK